MLQMSNRDVRDGLKQSLANRCGVENTSTSWTCISTHDQTPEQRSYRMAHNPDHHQHWLERQPIPL